MLVIPRRTAAPARRRSGGMTVIEMMVGIAAGMLIVAAMALLFANNSRTRTETERASRKIENGRYAMELLATDLEHAGYFDSFDPRQLPLPAAMPDPCTTDVAAMKTALPLHVQGYDNSDGGLSCITDVKTGTDVVVVRRASACAAGVGACPALPANMVGFQASSCSDPANGELSTANIANHYRLSKTAADFTLKRRNCATGAEIHRYLVRIYFVANNDKPGDGIPTLKRAELSASGGTLGFTTTSLVQGIDNLQAEYGMDTDGDGSPDVYSASPDIYQACTPEDCVAYWSGVVAAKVFLLSRSVEASPGYTDDKVFELGRVADADTGGGAPRTIGPIGDRYRRSLLHEVVRLQNPSSRRLSPS
ncbi:MAG TPA: PilW family protein [Ramlibacter sp.]|uniref:PilW family protein n=1 Tax=Ramlibacter sp. TaxID=1917967 RepID=UPI002D80093A|nr:PilW family protein [Ramlibacter sp.]HET8744145.1 PilW family protein [Ramlibacter sp.]